MTNNDFDTKLLISKAEDLAERTLKSGIPCFTAFLSDAQQHCIKTWAKYPHDDEKLIFFGGHDGSDYACAGFFPSYLFYDENFNPNESFPICAILAKGSGFRKLTHRDFLGSIMALGIKREVIGDIVVSCDGYSAFIFCLEKSSDFLISNFVSAANDKISCSICDITKIEIPKRETETINITVNSPRIDAIVATLLKLSRDDAERLITSGSISLNHVVCVEKSKICEENCLISIKHYGRFLVKEFGDRNRRDRLRIIINKII